MVYAIRAIKALQESCLFFDDRLATVLRQRATGEGALRTQYRQLLDLLGKDRTSARGNDQSLLAAAWLRMDALAEAIPAADRARMIREPGWRFHSPDLANHLADHEPEVAAAAITRADLTSDDWATLIPRLPVRARGFLRLRRDLPIDVEALLARLGVHDRGLPAPTSASATAHFAKPAQVPTTPEAAIVVPAPTPLRPVPSAPHPPRHADDGGRTEISALVERIAQYRKARENNAFDSEQSPRLPLGELTERPARAIASFGFAADTSGRIGWAAGEAAPMVVGTRLFAVQPAGANSERIARAFARRQPITAAPITLSGAPAIAGEWVIDAEPRFSDDGHFTGYLGRFRRAADPAAVPTGPEAREADRIRQLLHELRTPVTAVQGYAEVIQQQLFGPAPHEYRALAAAIAADAARILAGFEELDRLARLETGTMSMEPGETDLAALVRRTAAQLEPVLGLQSAGFALGFGPEITLFIRLDPEDAEALIWRLMASIGSACARDERITLRIEPMIGPHSAAARLVCELPASLAGEPNLFAATARSNAPGAINAGLFGTGFALRLARAEARAAGGSLQRDGAEIALSLPLLTGIDELSSAAGA
jgi:signal transduction histidine kinase